MIPTCVDLERYQPAREPPQQTVYGCVGTLLSGWFRLDWLAAWLVAAAADDPSARFEIVTRDDLPAVEAALDQAGSLAGRVEFSAATPDEMPRIFHGHSVALMFYNDGLDRLGCSPTRLGEALASGLPVVSNDGTGDVGAIVREYRVGVLLDGCDADAIAGSLSALRELRRDPDLSSRCRRAAVEVFALEAGTGRYAAIYAQAMGEAR